ncbi:hypothetical protein EJV47_14460 [Hymenobacter gummosus]|uniref:Uncharacterized protein n=1 Tax=Hymenobacter gummosus TaxID=1776032 RepID=A0A3S0JG31_9BACT|nr:hypothetical protein [Hymenobacter gummosus]RTQ48805.1 hypothetical protein EJV47_14460 [Hymenobacter gummosus]
MNNPASAIPSDSVLARAYFSAPPLNYWRWAEGGEIVEWRGGDTICYREELQVVLENLAPAGLPQLGAVLLLLAACSGAWARSGGAAALDELRRDARAWPDDGWNLRRATALLEAVAALPAELRTGPAKLHLLRTLLADPAHTAFETRHPLIATPERARLVLHEWISGRLSGPLIVSVTPQPELLQQVRADLPALVAAWQRIADGSADESVQKLTHLLRTGVVQPPAPLTQPVLPAPPAPSADLLSQLSQDARTYGLARLTQRLVAALHIPRHTREVSEQPLGGVADVTNRGSFDRLLLSELAHDDLTLLARLAGNEALYLRREAPPTQDVRPRLILLDTTLRLWGVPRVFGLAAALAWARLAQPARQRVPVAACALGGQQAEPLDLESFGGVVAALARLDAAPHCAAALPLALARPEAAGADALLITAAELLSQPTFAAALAAASPGLRFLLTVDRSGELQLHEFLRGGARVLLSTTRHDLDALLFAPMPTPVPAARPLTLTPALPGEPAFLAQQPAPLLFPTGGLKVSPKTAFFHPQLGLLGVSQQQRVLYCPRREQGARELLGYLEAGQNYFGYDAPSTVYVLVHTGPQLVFYSFATDSGQVERVELEEDVLATKPLTQVTYLQGCFYLRFGDGFRVPVGVTVFDCRRRHVVVRHTGPFPKPERPGFTIDRGQLKQFANNGYSTLQNLSRLRLSPAGELAIDGRALRLGPVRPGTEPHLQLYDMTPDAHLSHPAEPGPARQLLDNPQLHLRPHTWPDGSQAFVDTRGLLHLRSADPALPDVPLVLIIDRPTAAWAADGTVCGPDYFTGPDPALRLPAPQFYEQYIQPFIRQLQQ